MIAAEDSDLGAVSVAALSDHGPLAAAIADFRPRPAQQALAMAIASAIEARETLLAEAGTGTGKTFAYLVPVLLRGAKTIISTGTRALQDQLHQRDLPLVQRALGIGARTALLKGRANYLCLYRLERARGASRHPSREFAARLQQVTRWSRATRSGDLAELRDLPEDPALLAQITSSAENCLGSDCPFWDECFVVKARQAAQAADVVVVNHHLLLSDVALKQEGFGEILPGANVFVIDEAHQLPDLAQQFFGDAISARKLMDVVRDCLAECAQVTGALAQVQVPIRSLEHAVRELRLAFDTLPVRGGDELLCGANTQAALTGLDAALLALATAVAPLQPASPGFAAIGERLAALRRQLLPWLQMLAAGADAAVSTSESVPQVLWYELSAHGFVLHRSPLDVATPLRAFRAHSGAAWILTSATLAVDGSFAHIAARIGCEDARTLLQPSPFDWPSQALLYLPRDLPEPNHPGFADALEAQVRDLLTHSRGRAFLLFTSHRALRDMAQRLAGGPWPLFVQGEAPRTRLLERFRASGNGVLLGAASFWEGIDVAGDALSLVVIDRLPFATPDDPVLAARMAQVRASGGNPFYDEQVPQAVIALKQGVGRLIRNETDRGVLALCDSRLLSKSYGRLFLDSLPPLPRTRDMAEVERFFARFALEGVKDEHVPVGI